MMPPAGFEIPPGCEDVVREVFDEDAYRIGEIDPGAEVVDVGAHIGCFAVAALEQGAGRVWAYEPDPRNLPVLRRNLAPYGDRAIVVPAAVGLSTARDVRQFWSAPRTAESSLYNRTAGAVVTLVRAAGFAEVVAAAPGAFVLKVDAEGAEREVFSVAHLGEFARFRRVVAEWHDFDGHVYRDYLERRGFAVELRGVGVPQPAYDPSFAGGMLYATRPAVVAG